MESSDIRIHWVTVCLVRLAVFDLYVAGKGRGVDMIYNDFSDMLEDSPIIAAIKDETGLEKCIESELSVIFVLYGNVCNISRIIEKLKNAGKTVIVHLDLIEGLSTKAVAVDYINQYTG